MSEHQMEVVGGEEFRNKVLESDVPVVVDFWAPWCGPCLIVSPALEELANEYDGKFKVAKLNTDDNREIATRYGIMGIPTLKVFKNGEEVDSMTGAGTKDMLKSFIDRAIG